MSRRNIFYHETTDHLGLSTRTYSDEQKEPERKISQSCCELISRLKKEENEEYSSLSSSAEKRKFEKFKNFCKDDKRKDVSKELFESLNAVTSESTINSQNMFNLFSNSHTNHNILANTKTHRKKSSKHSISPENKTKEDLDVEEILKTVFNKHHEGNNSDENHRKNSFTQLKFKKKDDGKIYNFEDDNFESQKTIEKSNISLSNNVKNDGKRNQEYSNHENACEIIQKLEELQKLQKESPEKGEEFNENNQRKKEKRKANLKQITEHSFEEIEDKGKPEPNEYSEQESVYGIINEPCEACSKKEDVIQKLKTNMEQTIDIFRYTLESLRLSIEFEKEMLIGIILEIQDEFRMKIKQFESNMQIQKAEETQFIFMINSELNKENETKEEEIEKLTKQIQELSFQKLSQPKKESQSVEVQTFEIILTSKELIHQHTQSNYLEVFNKETQCLFDDSESDNRKNHSYLEQLAKKETQCCLEGNCEKEIQKETNIQIENNLATGQNKSIGGIVNSILEHENQRRVSDFSPKVTIENYHELKTKYSTRKKETHNSELNPNLSKLQNSKETENYYSSPPANDWKCHRRNNTSGNPIFENQFENLIETPTKNAELPKRFEISNLRKNRGKSENERIENKEYNSLTSSLGKQKFKNCYGSIQGIISKMKLNYS